MTAAFAAGAKFYEGKPARDGQRGQRARTDLQYGAEIRAPRALQADNPVSCINAPHVAISACLCGTDPANIWASSLAIPVLAEQVRQHRQADLDSRTGRLMTLFY